MKYHYKSTQYIANFLSLVCLVVFVCYSILLYLNHQSGILELTYYIESNLTSSSSSSTATWIAAILGTSLSVIPALILLLTLHFPLRLKALAFIPSYILLGFLTGISPKSVCSTENEVPFLAALCLLLFACVLIFFSQVYHEDRGEHSPVTNYLGSNIFISCIGIIFCISLTNTDRQLHLQLSMAKAFSTNDYISIEDTPSGEITSNNNITSLRVYHLSKNGRLADELFSLSSLKGSCSLFPDTLPASSLYNIPTMIYEHVHINPKDDNTDVTTLLEKALLEHNSPNIQSVDDNPAIKVTVDYYLCSLLLDRELNRFSSELLRYYDLSQPLPKHYREALALMKSIDNKTAILVQDSEMDSIYASYSLIRQSHLSNSAVQRKMCTLAYPSTYWNYYFYGCN